MVAVSRLHGMVPYLNKRYGNIAICSWEWSAHPFNAVDAATAGVKTARGTGLTPSQEGAVKCSGV